MTCTVSRVKFSEIFRIDVQARWKRILDATSPHPQRCTESRYPVIMGMVALSVALPCVGGTPVQRMYVRNDENGELQTAQGS